MIQRNAKGELWWGKYVDINGMWTFWYKFKLWPWRIV